MDKKKYNGIGGFSIDYAAAISVDCSRNVYAAGRIGSSESGSDYIITRPDKDGNRLGTRNYNGPANGFDEATAVAVDVSGNVYVTGPSHGGGGGFDFATV